MRIDFMKLGERIREYRTSASLSQEELASRTGLSNVHISSIENGKTNPKLDVIANIASELHITPNALLIDSLPTAGSNGFDQLLVGCPSDEAAILLEATQALKQTLDKYRITHK